MEQEKRASLETEAPHQNGLYNDDSTMLFDALQAAKAISWQGSWAITNEKGTFDNDPVNHAGDLHDFVSDLLAGKDLAQKDGPGFIGGKLGDKRGEKSLRNNANVLSRSILSYDFDHKEASDIEASFKALSGLLMVFHTSFKHGATDKETGKPDTRFRIHLPQKRDITAAEHGVLWKWGYYLLAGVLSSPPDDAPKAVSNFFNGFRAQNPDAIFPRQFKIIPGDPLDPDNLPDGQSVGSLQASETANKSPEKKVDTSAPNSRQEAYARGALTRACEKLSTLPEGERHSQALKESRSIGGLLWAGVSFDEAYEALVTAAVQSGLGKADSEKAVRAGLTEGQTLPREISEKPEMVSDMKKSGDTSDTGDTACGDEAFSVSPDENAGDTGDTKSIIPPAKDRPVFKVFDKWQEEGDQKIKPGVYFFGIKPAKEEVNLTQTWICAPLRVEALTFDGQDNNYGRLLNFLNSRGSWRKWAMPMELLRGSGEELRGYLLSMGLEIDMSARNLFQNYLQSIPPKKRMKCALQTGWNGGNSFVLPDRVIGPGSGDIIFQSGERSHDEYTQGGTLEGWRAGVAAMAIGNQLLTLALSAAFAGPLLEKCGSEGGGIHFVGDSSTGKSTIIEAACSVWGGSNFKRSWRGTANGMEGVASLFNDCLLALDEISESDPREIGTIVYSLMNGRGKQRANKTGTARGVSRWRCMVLSSGEKTIETHMREGGKEPKAGQGIRLLNIPAARSYGAWDNLRGLSSGAVFSDAIKAESTKNFGCPGRAFLEKLTADTKEFPELFRRFKAIPAFITEGSEGQEKRAAARFVIIGLAGELASEYGVTGWNEGDAIHAAGECFKTWLAIRGKGNDERRQVLSAVSSFIDRHGDSRFSHANAKDIPIIRDRAGWFHGEADDRRYLFHSDGLKEALTGHDLKRALDVLEEAGAITRGGDGKWVATHRVNGTTKKLYSIDPAKLGVEHGT